MSDEHRAGIAALIGRPNVGKSTLLNRLLRFKVSIVSPRPQTTRNRVMGVLHAERMQVAFVDTPGVWRGGTQRALQRRMLREVAEGMAGVDAVILLVDPAREPDPARNVELVSMIEPFAGRVILALNKIDRLERSALLPVLKAYGDTGAFRALVPISARRGDGIDGLLREVAALMPVGPPLFPEDMLTDSSERFLCAELIREKVFRRTGQEIPYATAVQIERFEEVTGRSLVRIFARILVEKESQKRIVIGKGGVRIKEIGTAARRDMERLLGSRVYLDLHVSVSRDWSRRPQDVERLGHFDDRSGGG